MTGWHNGMAPGQRERYARMAGHLYIGSEPADPDAFCDRVKALALERVSMARELTLARILPFADAVAAATDGDVFLPATALAEVRTDALRALMETPQLLEEFLARDASRPARMARIASFDAGGALP